LIFLKETLDPETISPTGPGIFQSAVWTGRLVDTDEFSAAGAQYGTSRLILHHLSTNMVLEAYYSTAGFLAATIMAPTCNPIGLHCMYPIGEAGKWRGECNFTANVMACQLKPAVEKVHRIAGIL
jgi:hypothetical protein